MEDNDVIRCIFMAEVVTLKQSMVDVFVKQIKVINNTKLSSTVTRLAYDLPLIFNFLINVF